MKTYDYQPGNGSRYFLTYGPVEGGGFLLAWLRKGDVGGSAFRVMPYFGVIDQSYFMEKTGITNEADAAALLGFLANEGHEVRIFSDYDSRGRWSPSVVPLECV